MSFHTPDESRVQSSLILVLRAFHGVNEVIRLTPKDGRMTYKTKKCQKNKKKDR